MKHLPVAILLTTCGMMTLSAGCSRDVSYAEDIKPLLSERCGTCHKPGGEGQVASGFSIEDYASLMKGTRFGPVIEPGKSVNSTLVRMVEHKTAKQIHMPKEKAMLAEHEIEMLKRWIDAGAANN